MGLVVLEWIVLDEIYCHWCCPQCNQVSSWNDVVDGFLSG